MAISLLIDENLRGILWKALERHNVISRFPLDVVRVGDIAELPIGSQDPDILAWAARENRVLLSNDRKTMRRHFEEFLSLHGSSPGILLLRPRMTVPDVLDYLVLVQYASTPADWVNRASYIPPT